MAKSNLARRLDKLERAIRERKLLDTPHLYLREGEPAPDGVNVTYIVRTYIEPPERAEDELPAAPEPQASESEKPQRREPLEYPNLGLV